MRSKLGILLAASLSLLTASAPAPAAMPTVYNLGTLGGTNSYGYAVNDAGQVAGYSHTWGNTIPHAFRCDGSTGGTWQLS